VGRPRYDFWEILFLGNKVLMSLAKRYSQEAVHQQADLIQDNIESVRAVTENENDPQASIRKTDKAMGCGFF
jgi:glyceraldehyde-3-phosphate dehydrogenase (NAD(P))